MLGGALSIHRLALEQYPDIAPTQISVSATYTGASAKTLEDSVTQVIEQNMKGLDRLQSMSSTSASNGQARNAELYRRDEWRRGADASTEQGTAGRRPSAPSRAKPGRDRHQIRRRLSADRLADFRYPSATAVDIGDYVASNLVDVISRVNGVGEVVTSARAMQCASG